MHVDGPLFERVLINLLENAHKYAGARASIGIRAEADARQLSLEVWDNGPGIPAGQSRLSLINSPAATKSRRSGVGLGLAICQAIVDVHGGTISASNRPGAAPHSVLHCTEKRPLNWKSYLRNCD